MNTNNHMALLRILADDFYNNKITFSVYRKERAQLLKNIDEDVNGVFINEDVVDVEKSFVNKALSFLKIDKFKE